MRTWINPFYLNEVNWKKFWRLVRKQKPSVVENWVNWHSYSDSCIYNTFSTIMSDGIKLN
jgi:hypothetical protein